MQSRPIRNQQYSNYRPKGGRRFQNKRRRGRKGGKRGRSGLSGAAIVGALASSGYRYLFNTENKYTLVTFSSNVASTGFSTLLNGLIQGTGVSNRIGDSIKIVRMVWNCSFTISSIATTSFVRYIIFRDNQPDGTAPPTLTGLLDSASYNSLYNPEYSKRFFVYYDKVVALNTNGDECLLDDKGKDTVFHVRYGLGNAGTVADISTNSLYVCAISDQSANFPNMTFNLRLLYVDN